MFDREVLEAIKQDAIQRYPNESCGLVLKRGDGSHAYVSAPNVSQKPRSSFHIDEQLVLSVLPSIAAIVHSHPDGPDCPSESDMRQQLQFNLPFGIVSTDGVGCLDPFFWGDTVETPPLLGRGFRHGVTDCYALIRDYYKLNLNITLREYPRDWEWWESGARLYEDHFAREGFKRIAEQDVKEHDCFLAQIRSSTPNHAGVYIGKNLILHHLTSKLPADAARLSRRDPVGAWNKFICGFWVRHESLND